jgi:ABC-type glycerol-3-phosphate transport system substrate-binding protein
MTGNNNPWTAGSPITRRRLLNAFAVAGGLGLASPLLSACVPGSSGGGEEKLAPSPSAAASGTVTLWMRDDDLLKVFKTVIPAFNKKYPDVKVNMVGVDIATKLPPTLISGTGVPDGSFYEDVNIGAQAAHLFDLTDLMAPHAADTLQFKLDVATYDQKLVAVPWDTDPGMLYYRESVLSDAGVDPAGLTTFDSLLDGARTIKEKFPKARPIPLEQDANLGMQWLMMMINQQQGTGLVDANGALTIDTDAFRRALTWIKTVADEELGARSKFASTGHVAQLDDGTISLVPWAIWFNFLPQTGLKTSKGDWRVGLLPAWEEGGARSGVMGGSSFVIPKKAKNPQLAWLFYEFAMYDPAGYGTVYGPNDTYPNGLNTALPSVKAALEGPPLFKPVAALGNQDLWSIDTEAAKAIPPGYRIPSWFNSAAAYLGVNMQKMIDGKASVDEVINVSVEQITKNLVDRQR